MEKNVNDFQTHCTWKAVDNKLITEAVSWTDGNENPDIEDSIQAENCVLLELPNEVPEGAPGSECRLIFFCHAPYFIQQVTVLCEARLIEVYGRHSEYLKTVRNEMVDEVDDMIVFRGDVKLERPSIECSLKFTGLKTKSSMWLYGVTVKVGSTIGSPGSGSSYLGNFQPNATDLNQNNNAQFMSLMSSMFGPPRPTQPANAPQPSIHPNLAPNLGASVWHQPSTEPAMNGSAHPAAQFLQNLIQPQPPAPIAPPPVAAPSAGSDMIQLFMSMMQNAGSTAPQAQTTPYNPLSAQQQMAALLAQAASPGVAPPSLTTPTQLAAPAPLTDSATPALTTPQPAQILNESQPTMDNKSTQEVVKTESTEITSGANTTNGTEADGSRLEAKIESTVATTSTVVPGTSAKESPVAADNQLRELAVELRPETVDQITEAVINNIDCSLENLEARLWGKIVHRLSDMETRILARMEEVVDALREEEEEEDRLAEVEEADEEELEDEEEPLSGGEGSMLEI